MKQTVATVLRVLGILLGLAWIWGTLANIVFPETYVCNTGNHCPSPPSVLERAAANALFFVAGCLLLVPQKKCRQPIARKVYGLLLAGFSLFLAAFWLWQLIYTVSGKALADWLQQGRRLQILNRVCGAIFILIAVSLLWDSMHVLLG